MYMPFHCTLPMVTSPVCMAEAYNLSVAYFYVVDFYIWKSCLGEVSPLEAISALASDQMTFVAFNAPSAL